jgi:hypothetical protein
MKGKKIGFLRHLALVPFFLVPTQKIFAQIDTIKNKFEQIISTKKITPYTSVDQWLDSTIIATNPDTFKKHLEYFLEQNFFETVVDINAYKQNIDSELLKQKIRDLNQLFTEYNSKNQELSFVYKDLFKPKIKRNKLTINDAIKVQNTIRFLQQNTNLLSPGQNSNIFQLIEDSENMRFDCSERVILAIHWLKQSGINLKDIGINIYYDYDDTKQMHMTLTIFGQEIDVTQRNLQVHESILEGKKIIFKTVSEGAYFLFSETPNKLDPDRAKYFNILWSMTSETIGLHEAQKINHKH